MFPCGAGAFLSVYLVSVSTLFWLKTASNMLTTSVTWIIPRFLWAGLKMFRLLLKETGMRCGEACDLLKWTEIDLEQRSVRITPEKGSTP